MRWNGFAKGVGTIAVLDRYNERHGGVIGRMIYNVDDMVVPKEIFAEHVDAFLRGVSGRGSTSTLDAAGGGPEEYSLSPLMEALAAFDGLRGVGVDGVE